MGNLRISLELCSNQTRATVIRDTAIVSSSFKGVALHNVNTVSSTHTIGISEETFNILSKGTVLNLKCSAQYQG